MQFTGTVPPYDLTYEDVFMVPRRSKVDSRQGVDLATTDGTGTTIPLVVANMTSVAGRRMAETIARRGGLAVIPQDIPVDVVASVIAWVKSRHLLYDTPLTLETTATVGEAVNLLPKRAHGGLVVMDHGVPVGVVTEADCAGVDRYTQLHQVMSRELLTLPAGIDPREAFDLLHEGRHKLAPVVDETGALVGLLTRSGALRSTLYQPALDASGRLRVAAAVGVNGDVPAKATALLAAGADVLVVDTAHGHQEKMLAVLREIRRLDPQVPVVAGNVVTAEGTAALIEAGADIVKAGVGPGCCGPGTRVLMANGTYKNIEDIVAGDRVITGEGKPTRVVKAWCTGIREVVGVRHVASGVETLVTSDHRFLVGDLSSVSAATALAVGYARVLRPPTRFGESKIRWQEIGEVDRAALLSPGKAQFELPAHLRIDLREFATREKQLERYNVVVEESEDLGYMLGFFLGDGSVHMGRKRRNPTGSVGFYVGLHEPAVQERLLDCVERVTGVRPALGRAERGKQDLALYSLQWARILERCGKKAEKHLPPEWLCSDPAYLRGLLQGLIDSDGHVDSGGRPCFRNTSRSLSELYGVLCLLIEGTLPNVVVGPGSAGGLPGVRDEDCLPSFKSRLNSTHERRHLGEHSIVKLLAIRETGLHLPVYDIEVEDEHHSFIADNVIVHNSMCTTRMMTGVGRPQFSAVLECAAEARRQGGHVWADGGVKHPRDVALALAAGASQVMVGSWFAGTHESPGDTLRDEKGRLYKESFGMASARAVRFRTTSETPFERARKALFEEGISTSKMYLDPDRPGAEDLLDMIIAGVRSSCTYAGAINLEEFHERARVGVQSAAGYAEGRPRHESW